MESDHCELSKLNSLVSLWNRLDLLCEIVYFLQNINLIQDIPVLKSFIKKLTLLRNISNKPIVL